MTENEDRPPEGPMRAGESRRHWLGRTAALLAAWEARAHFPGGRARGDDAPALIVRNRRPADLETPVTALDGWLTPTDRFFVRSHFGPPATDVGPWPIEVGGMVERALSLSPESIAELPQFTVTAVLQCAGNGRAFFRPNIPGVPWGRGAVGQGEWKGARLADVLERAGIKPGAAHVRFLGGDGPPSPKTPAYFRSLPLAKALDPSTLIVTELNGAPLPPLLGGPVRLVVPGWTGNHWMKWLRWVTVSDAEAPGLYQQIGYKIPKSPAPPDAVLAPADLVPVTAMNVKSLITSPGEGAALPPGRVEVKGVAWTGEGTVTEVSVNVEGTDAWRPAELIDPARPFAWRRWRVVLDGPGAGPFVVRSRATDSSGESQPETTPWNKSGYLWNAIDRVAIKVG